MVVILGAAALLLWPGQASARQVSFRSGAQAVQSLSSAYYLIDFEFDGDEAPLFLFDFDQPAYGFVYTRPHFMVTFAAGDQGADDEGRENLRLIDLSLTTWGELGLGGMSTGRSRAYIPIVLFSNYRRISPQDAGSTLLEAFNVTVLGLGLGLGLESVLGERVFFEARANPIFGFASSSLTDAFGSAYLIDIDAQLHLAQLFGAVGLSLGYSFRLQAWNLNTSNLFPDATDEFFDYKGRRAAGSAVICWMPTPVAPPVAVICKTPLLSANVPAPSTASTAAITLASVGPMAPKSTVT